MLQEERKKGDFINMIKKRLINIGKKILSNLPQVFSYPFLHGKLVNFLPEGRTFIKKNYLGKYSLYVDTKYDLERHLLGDVYEPDTISAIRHYVKKNNTCIDVGANIGAITFALADSVGEDGKVYAFEPGPQIYSRLIANIGLNSFVKRIIIPLNLGISNVVTELYWAEDPGYLGNAGFLVDKEKWTNGVMVSVTTLDIFFKDYLENNNRIDFIKIDVEGLEYEVILGAEKIIEQFKPIIFYETAISIEKQRPMILKNIEDRLLHHDYKLYMYKGGLLIPVKYPKYDVNTIAIYR